MYEKTYNVHDYNNSTTCLYLKHYIECHVTSIYLFDLRKRCHLCCNQYVCMLLSFIYYSSKFECSILNFWRQFLIDILLHVLTFYNESHDFKYRYMGIDTFPYFGWKLINVVFGVFVSFAIIPCLFILYFLSKFTSIF